MQRKEKTQDYEYSKIMNTKSKYKSAAAEIMCLQSKELAKPLQNRLYFKSMPFIDVHFICIFIGQNSSVSVDCALAVVKEWSRG